MRALLLDFGGVLVDGAGPPGWRRAWSDAVGERLGAHLPAGFAVDLEAALDAYAHWCESMCRPWAPEELDQRRFWTDLVAADWPSAARDAAAEQAAELCEELGRASQGWCLRPGVPELLAGAADRGIGLGIVSNTLYGAVHRRFLAGQGLADRFGVQLYSDEVGLRKPNPELIRLACTALGVPPGDAWYVGDTWSRDVRCGMRAGVGRTVLMHSTRTPTDRTRPRPRPDMEVADPVELLARLP
jgi:N-acetyl-D-muramate 6-phosphate phosphatase